MTDKTDIAALMRGMRDLADRIIEAQGENSEGEEIIHLYDESDTTFRAKNVLLVLNAFDAEHQQREAAEKEATYWCNLNAQKNEVIDQRNGECDRLIRENEALLARLAPKDITPFAYAYQYAGCETTSGFEDWRNELSRVRPAEWMLETGKVTGLIELFTTQQMPVAPEGWQLVPIEPTESMVIDGFESKPDESFSPRDVWEGYDAMSGCGQAAHRAKLCWAAMLAAAPKFGGEPDNQS